MSAARIVLLAGPFLILLASSAPLPGDNQAIAADEAVLHKAGLAADGPALLAFFRRQTLSAADQARLTATVQRLGDAAFVVREKASADLVSAGRSVLPLLRSALE